VYLVRHGQSEWNVLRRTQGQTHHPGLTPLGRVQAAAAAELVAADLPAYLPAGRQARVLTSDLARAVETASVVGFRLGTRPVADVRLRERQLGELEGTGYDETSAAGDAHAGETLDDLSARMRAVLSDLSPVEVTVLVSHGDALRALVAGLGGADPGELANGAVGRWDGVSLHWLG
jgi:broad specificity phosphatase PhoE